MWWRAGEGDVGSECTKHAALCAPLRERAYGLKTGWCFVMLCAGGTQWTMPHGSMGYMPHAPQKKGRHVMRGPRRGHARLRRMKRVPMPRGAASEVACGALCEVSILWTGSCAPHRPPLPSVPVMPMCAAFNASRCPAGRPLRWAVEGDRK